MVCLGTLLTGCSLFTRSPEQIESDNRKYLKLVEDKASEYGIDPDGVTVEEGGEYFRVPMDPILTIEGMDEYIVNFRRWLRFAYGELGNRYYVGFFDREHPEIMYGGFSDQDFGYPSEYYWNDLYVVDNYVSALHKYTSESNKKNDMTPEEFCEMTGITREFSEELWDWFHETYYSRPSVTPDKDEHDIAFIPGDNIQHLEKFVVGDDDCVIEPGTYLIDLPSRYGLIHITDADGNDKCRLYVNYPDGRVDELYVYSAMPAEVELEEGDIIYLTNCDCTFDEVD